MNALFRALGVDDGQWRALTVAALKVDLRASSLGRPATVSRQMRGAGALIGQVVFYTMLGVGMGFVVSVAGDPFLAAVIVLSYVVFMVGTIVLLDHNTAVTSPDDYAILGCRPVDSRTYFAAKLTNVFVYILAVTAAFGWIPIAAFFVRHGAAVGAAALLAVSLCAMATTLALVSAYAWLLRVVGPGRLRTVLSYLQFILSFVVYGGYFFFTRVFSRSLLANASIDRTGPILAYPATWFAAYVDLAAGRATGLEAGAAVASVLLLAGLAWLALGRLSLGYAERLGAISSASAPRSASTATLRPGRLFRAGEARAIALLIRAQFRNDTRFRLSVLAIIPMTVIYMVMGLTDRHAANAAASRSTGGSLAMVALAILLFPTMLKTTLARSDAFRASWVFFASPVDRMALVRSAKNVLVVFFLVPYLTIVTVALAWLTGNVWPTLVFVLFTGLLSHFVLLFVTFLNPELPFSQPTVKTRASSSTFALIVILGLAIGFMGFFLDLAGRQPVTLGVIVAALVAASVVLDRMTRARVGRQTERIEFAG